MIVLWVQISSAHRWLSFHYELLGQALLSGQLVFCGLPVLNSHPAIPRGWLLNTGLTEKFIFTTKILHLAWFSNYYFLELGNGLWESSFHITYLASWIKIPVIVL